MEVFAGYSANADWNVGRLLDAVEDMGDLDNTLIFYIWGDKAPYAFTGTVKKVVFDLKPATHQDEQALHQHAQIQGVGEGAAG
jgi:arylsulfatase A-like enzyme